MDKRPQFQDNIAASLLLETIFNWFDENGYKYCVQRNYEGYPDRITGDVDLVVTIGMTSQIVEGILEVAYKLGWSCYFEHTWEKTSFIGLCKSIFPSRYTLTIELFAGAGWHGISYLSSSFILAHCTRFGITWKPFPAHQAIITVIHHLLYNGHVPPKYRDEILHLVKENPEIFQNILSKSFGSSLANLSYDTIIRENWDELSYQVNRFKFNILFRATKTPIKLITNIINGYNASCRIPEGIVLMVNSAKKNQSHEICNALLKSANNWHIFYPSYRKKFNICNENIRKINELNKQIHRIIGHGGVCIINCGNSFTSDFNLPYPFYSIHYSDKYLSIRSIGENHDLSLTDIDCNGYPIEQIAHKIWNDLLDDRARRFSLRNNYIHG